MVDGAVQLVMFLVEFYYTTISAHMAELFFYCYN